MGASSWTAEFKGQDEKRFIKKFNEAMDQERIYYGTDPYSGSLATLSGVRIVSDPLPGRKWTKKKKREVIDNLLDRAEKWEDALAVKTSNSFLVVAWLAS